ncbi:pq loop repeat family protein [Anaeramoeba flamelloides]|uniref:Pq loop repeat family protein n=1 Tax=Anaeramoeba flamelloides TaxID=1746091 RepID=A0AAV7YHB0_9EUKA|nr:pq loop repeat family protein [Anaeramoeba flamelloides]KAJ6252855.1 pq loop repeat family protein [Anaeramoeba flamelloides]
MTNCSDEPIFSGPGMACMCGLIASICFTIQYAPQALLNYQRKSVKGFSTTGIIIKLVGACFLMVNSYLDSQPYPVVLYGLFNVIQHSIFMVQFSIYENKLDFLYWLLFPFFPYVLGSGIPSSQLLTNYIKPIAQVFSHFPQLYLCYKSQTTMGVSLISQHLNVIGGGLGLIMCFVLKPSRYSTYMVYFNSIFQALTLYYLSIKYNEFRLLDKKKQKLPININKITKI